MFKNLFLLWLLCSSVYAGEWKKMDLMIPLPSPKGAFDFRSVWCEIENFRVQRMYIPLHPGEKTLQGDSSIPGYLASAEIIGSEFEISLRSRHRGRGGSDISYDYDIIFSITPQGKWGYDLFSEELQYSYHTEGALPLIMTHPKKLVSWLTELIRRSKGQRARVENPFIGVSDRKLAETLIEAAEGYGIPLSLFVALIYVEDKFSVGDFDGDIQGPAQLSLKYAIRDLEQNYFKSSDAAIVLRGKKQLRPHPARWNYYRDNILYGAAYVRRLYLYYQPILESLGAPINPSELWKFVLVGYNLGPAAGLTAWQRAGQPREWNSPFVDLLNAGEKREYAGNVFFYKQLIDRGTTNLSQYDSGPQEHVRTQFVGQFNR